MSLSKQEKGSSNSSFFLVGKGPDKNLLSYMNPILFRALGGVLSPGWGGVLHSSQAVRLPCFLKHWHGFSGGHQVETEYVILGDPCLRAIIFVPLVQGAP